MADGEDGGHDLAAEAPELTREPLGSGPPSRFRPPSRRHALNLASALAALALAIFLIAGGIVRLPGTPSRGVSATPTFTPTPLQVTADEAATAAAQAAGGGWLAAGPPEAQSIAFAPSDPLTAYTCGVSPSVSTGQAGPIVVEVSHDGGTTWARRPVPATDAACWLSVDPLDAADVALEVATATPSQLGTPAPTTLYRSFDGGASWAPFAPPPRAPGGPGAISDYQLTWFGGALFVAPYYIGEDGRTRVAVSRHGGALTWLDTAALFAGTAQGTSINRLLSTSLSLYAEVNPNIPDCAPDCFKVLRSRDGGMTWEDFIPHLEGSEVQALDAEPDLPILFGYNVATNSGSPTYAHSEDDGATWTSLPPLPPGLVATFLVATPRGDTYAAVWTFGTLAPGVPLGIYALRPESGRAWTFVAPYSHGGGGPNVSWDPTGAPLWLWGNATQPADQGPAVGFERHRP